MSRARRLGARSMVVLSLLLAMRGTAAAGSLDPNDFPSLGSFQPSPGTYDISTNGTPLLFGSGVNIQGVVSNGAAVFDFDSIAIGSGVTIEATFTGLGSQDRPLALLSRGDVTISGTGQINVTVGGGEGGSGGVTSPGGGPGGGGAGRGGNGITAGGGPGGGGGFGGAGGVGGGRFGGAGGGTYGGNLAQLLQGGSGGGGGGSAGGGHGGGAIEIGAIGAIALGGNGIVANGLSAATFEPSGGGAGGGSGGGIFLHGNSVTLKSLLGAHGGDGSAGFGGSDFGFGGGGGGGGRVLIEYGPGGFTNTSSIDVSGGLGGSGPFGVGGNGAPGQVTIATSAVPEPATLILLETGLLGVLGLGYAARTRRAKATDLEPASKSGATGSRGHGAGFRFRGVRGPAASCDE